MSWRMLGATTTSLVKTMGRIWALLSRVRLSTRYLASKRLNLWRALAFART